MAFSMAYIFSSAQYISHYTLTTEYKADTLTDKESGTRFVLDSSRIYIMALDKQGRKLWKTDPWKDNRIDSYRVDRPVIVSFELGESKRDNHQEVIWISYSNTQFGTINKANGKFNFMGQD